MAAAAARRSSGVPLSGDFHPIALELALRGIRLTAYESLCQALWVKSNAFPPLTGEVEFIRGWRFGIVGCASLGRMVRGRRARLSHGVGDCGIFPFSSGRRRPSPKCIYLPLILPVKRFHSSRIVSPSFTGCDSKISVARKFRVGVRHGGRRRVGGCRAPVPKEVPVPRTLDQTFDGWQISGVRAHVDRWTDPRVSFRLRVSRATGAEAADRRPLTKR